MSSPTSSSPTFHVKVTDDPVIADGGGGGAVDLPMYIVQVNSRSCGSWALHSNITTSPTWSLSGSIAVEGMLSEGVTPRPNESIIDSMTGYHWRSGPAALLCFAARFCH